MTRKGDMWTRDAAALDCERDGTRGYPHVRGIHWGFSLRTPRHMRYTCVVRVAVGVRACVARGGVDLLCVNNVECVRGSNCQYTIYFWRLRESAESARAGARNVPALAASINFFASAPSGRPPRYARRAARTWRKYAAGAPRRTASPPHRGPAACRARRSSDTRGASGSPGHAPW